VSVFCLEPSCKLCEQNEVCKLQDGGMRNETFKGNNYQVLEMRCRSESEDIRLPENDAGRENTISMQALFPE